LLAFIGYRANVPQSAETIHGMRLVMIALPAVLAASAAAIIALYPIGPAMHARMVRALEWRRKRSAQQT
jgi:glycoside/pentoside/hexuronide:cation symporter, GPH family